MVDLYKLLPEEWFEQLGDFDTHVETYTPLNYKKVTSSTERSTLRLMFPDSL